MWQPVKTIAAAVVRLPYNQQTENGWPKRSAVSHYKDMKK